MAGVERQHMCWQRGRMAFAVGMPATMTVMTENTLLGTLILQIFCLVALLGVWAVMMALERRYEAQGFSWRHSGQSTMLALLLLSAAAVALVGVRLMAAGIYP